MLFLIFVFLIFKPLKGGGGLGGTKAMDSATVDPRVLRLRENNRIWKAANPDKVRAQARLDHARKVAADPEYNRRRRRGAEG